MERGSLAPKCKCPMPPKKVLATYIEEELTEDALSLIVEEPLGLHFATQWIDTEEGCADLAELMKDIYEFKFTKGLAANDVLRRNAAELVRKVKAAAYVREHPNEVCPAKWEEGETTLAPSLDLVGKI